MEYAVAAPSEDGGQLDDPAALPSGKNGYRYSLVKSLGGPQSWSGRHGEGKNYLSVPGIKP
jgi:hypothetical protein